MIPSINLRFVIFLLSVLISFPSLAQVKEPTAEGAAPDEKEKKQEKIEEETSTTKHKGTFGGNELVYTATAGNLCSEKG